MTCIISGISTAMSAGLTATFLSAWAKAWAVSWVFAFPTLLFVIPLVRRLVALVVEASAAK